MTKALIFDFDGTMIDSEWLFYESINNYLMEQFHYQIPFAEYQQGVGTAAELSFYERLSQDIGQPIDAESFAQQIVVDQKRNYAEAKLRPGIGELIELARQQQWKIGVVSNSEMLELAYYFDSHPTIKKQIDVFVTIDDLQLGKPDPEGYLLCLNRLMVEHAVVIEDSPVGAQAAVAAGLETYVYPNKLTKEMTFPPEVREFRQVQELFNHQYKKA
ncbi:HAD family hydrolase [Enterococcus sp. AZ163]|uniref:HAD family hydrolase n=1 Tax=Enterococcus sp. AZ163 TaxID=2774638 RepID=UPI003D28C176